MSSSLRPAPRTPTVLRAIRAAGRRARRVAPTWAVDVADKVAYAARIVRYSRPQTFNDKVHFKMLRDRRPILSTFADKVAVRDLVLAEAGGLVKVPRLLGVFEAAEDLARAELPREYVLKAAHASGGVIVVSDSADPSLRLPEPSAHWPHVAVRPEHCEGNRLEALCRHWLSRSYGGGQYREWAYVGVPRRLIVEELLRGDDGGLPSDFKVFVFSGVPRLIQIDGNRFGQHRQTFLDTSWNALDVRYLAPPHDVVPPRPAALDVLLEVAARLSMGFDFVRVDLYLISGEIVFGELTSYPNAGRVRFQPEPFEREVGSWWEVPRQYR